MISGCACDECCVSVEPPQRSRREMLADDVNLGLQFFLSAMLVVASFII
jgi:hypothetical protein